MKRDKLRLFELPEEYTDSFVAAYRVMEKTVNPAFYIVFHCAKCGASKAQFVHSVKNESVIIGIQCRSPGCGQTIKFMRPIDRHAPDFPDRLKDYPKSALESENQAGEPDAETIEFYAQLFEGPFWPN